MIGSLDTYFAVLKYTKDHKISALFNYILSKSEDGSGGWGSCILLEKDIIETCLIKSEDISKHLKKLSKKHQLLNYNYHLYLSGNDKIELNINKKVYHNVIYGVI